MKKILLSVFLFLGILTLNVDALTFENYEYELRSDGDVKITSYKGTDKVVEVPEQIDGKKVVELASKTFNYSQVSEVTLPGSVKNIPRYLFYNCSSLRTVVISEGTEVIEDGFTSGYYLNDLYIPASVKKIESNPAEFSSSDFKYHLSPNSPYFVINDDILYTKDMKTLVSYSRYKEQDSFVVPNTVENIGKKAFYNNETLKKLVIPKNVKTLGNYSISYLKKLEYLEIGTSMDKWKSYVVESNHNLKEMVFSGKIEVFPSQSLSDLRVIEKITLPSSVVEINGYWLNGCNKNVSVNYPKGLTTIEDGTMILTYDYTLKEGTFDYDEAKKVLNLVNQERKKVGLGALKIDAELMEAAMVRARETAVFFSHSRPIGYDCFSISEKASRENIATGTHTVYGAKEAMNAWMNSSGHKANILASDNKSIGIGYYYHNGTHFWVQLFSRQESASTNVKSGKIKDTNLKVKVGYVNDTAVYLEYPSKNFKNNKISIDRGESVLPISYGASNWGWYYVSFEVKPNSITYKSLNPDIFTVDSVGKITGLKAGKGKLQISLGNYKGTYDVTVNNTTHIASVKINQKSLNVMVGKTSKLTATINPGNTTQSKTLTWTSSNKKIATVDKNGNVKGIKAGTANITVKTSNGKTHTIKVTVKKPTPIKSIKLNKKTLKLELNKTYQLKTTINPSSTTDSKVLTWSTSNKKVAIVDKNGKITAVGGGSATITVKTSNKKKATVKVTVSKINAKKATISAIKNQVQTGKSLKPTVQVKLNGKVLKNGKDYTVSYKNNKKAGKATLTVKFKGNYTGTKTGSFIIIPSKVNIKNPSTSKKSITVKYSKVSGAKTYQTAYRLKGSNKWSYTTKSKISKLTSGKEYEVMVRAGIKSGSKTLYGTWSNVKTIKVK